MFLLDLFLKKYASLALLAAYLDQHFFIKILCEVVLINMYVLLIGLAGSTCAYYTNRFFGNQSGSWSDYCKKRMLGQFVLAWVVYAFAVYIQ